MLELAGSKIILREFTAENLHDKKYYNWLRDLDIVSMLYRLEYLKPLAFESVEKYANNLIKSENDCFFAIYYKPSLEFIGTFRLGHINWRTAVADVGIMIGNKEFWGQGLASETIKIAIKYAFQTLSLRKLIGGTPSINVAMCKSFERNGFMREAVKRKELLINGEFVDHFLYGLLKDDISQ